MGISHERKIRDAVQDIFHVLPTCYKRERLLGPRQVVTVLMIMIREQCGYERGLALAHEGHGDVLKIEQQAAWSSGTAQGAKRRSMLLRLA